jgi:hypothetical protein
VPDVDDRCLARRIEIALSVFIDEPTTFAPNDERKLLFEIA